MNISVFIPQIWYDFIGRVVPGTYMIVYVVGLRRLTSATSTGPADWLNGASTAYSILVLFALLVAAYLLGTLVGALWLASGDWMPIINKEHLVTVMSNEEVKLLDQLREPKDREKKFSENLIPYIYDTIQLEFPKMGARIAKLRAEQHLCGALALGSLLLAIYTCCVDSARLWWLVLLSLVVVPLFSLVLYRHLVDRAGKAMISGWIALRNKVSEK